MARSRVKKYTKDYFYDRELKRVNKTKAPAPSTIWKHVLKQRKSHNAKYHRTCYENIRKKLNRDKIAANFRGLMKYELDSHYNKLGADVFNRRRSKRG